MPKRNVKDYYARQFGLPVDQVRFFDELTDDQVSEVFWNFSPVDPEKYVYALKSTGKLVSSRQDRNYLNERGL